jgi:hypothetical protein
VYEPYKLINCIDNTITEIEDNYPNANVILSGDFNAITDEQIAEFTSMHCIVEEPTRGKNKLDKILVTQKSYEHVKVVKPSTKTDHLAIIAYSGESTPKVNILREKRIYRPITSSLHANFLAHMNLNGFAIDVSGHPQEHFDNFYNKITELLNQFYPTKTVTLRSTDPSYMTPQIKHLLKKKNRLMHANRMEEAGSIAYTIGGLIIKANTSQLNSLDKNADLKTMWQTIRRLTGKVKLQEANPNITADELNKHYAEISTDQHYSTPQQKQISDIGVVLFTE